MSRVPVTPVSVSPGREGLPLVSVLVPAFNEGAIIETNLGRIIDYMQTLSTRCRFELVIVDDGSTDRTGEIALARAASHPNVHVARHRVNLGLGQAMRTGFRRCRGDVIVVIDLDLTYAPEHIGRLLERQWETGADIVVASPYMRGGRTTAVPWTRRILSRWGNRFLALTAAGVSASGNLSTLTGMVRAYDAAFIRGLNLKSTGMEINTEIIYKGTVLDARIEEVPAHLDWSARRQGHSIWASHRRIRRGIVLVLLAGFIIRPFAFFIIPGALLACASLYLMAWISYHVALHYGQVALPGAGFDAVFSEAVSRAFQQSPHSFIVAGVTTLLSFQLFSLGIIALQAKQYFEELFHFNTHIAGRTGELERCLAELAASRSPGEPDGTAVGGPG